MPSYSTKTCNFCGIKNTADNMVRAQKTSEVKIKNSVTTRDVLGTLVGSKTSQRSLNKAIFSGGGRTATRKSEVWSCYECQGLESPEEKTERLIREREEKTERLIREKEQKTQNKTNIIKLKQLKQDTRVDDKEINTRIENYIELIANKELSKKDKDILISAANEMLKHSNKAKDALGNITYDSEKSELIIPDEVISLWKPIEPKNDIYFPMKNRNGGGFFGWLFSIAFVHLIKDLLVGNVSLLVSIGIYLVLLLLWKFFVYQTETPSQDAKEFGISLSNLEKELQTTHRNTLALFKINFNKKYTGVKSSKNIGTDQSEKSNKLLFKKMISTGKEIGICELVLYYHIANIDGDFSNEEDKEITSKTKLSNAHVNIARKIYSDTNNIDKVIKLIDLKLDSDGKMAVINNLISLAGSDLQIHESESEEIKKICRTWKLPLHGITRILDNKKNEYGFVDYEEIPDSDSDILEELF